MVGVLITFKSPLRPFIKGGHNLKTMPENVQKSLINLKKAKSLLEKIIEMIEEKEYCIDVMQQNMAAIGLLKSVHQMQMENHLNTCFKNAMAAKNDKLKQKMIEEILRVCSLANK